MILLLLGLLLHDVAPMWGHDRIEGGFDVNVEAVFGEGWVRPNVGLSINSQGYTSRVYGGAVFCVRPGRVALDLGLGFALQKDAVRNLSSAVLFRLSAEVGYRFGRYRVSILFSHISNGGLADKNAGMDVIGIRGGYHF